MFGVHWIPTHRGNLGKTPDRDVFARWAPQFVKIVTVDDKVPYLEDVPAGAQIIVRNHPMSEDGNRGAEATWYEGSGDPAGISLDGTAQSNPRIEYAEASGETPESIAYRHGLRCSAMADYCASRGVPASRLVFEGLNEPQLWAGEPPAWVARYYRAFLLNLHSYGLRGVVGNFGVGWPGNGGIKDAPVQWDFFKPVIEVFQPGDHLGLHEYWALSGPGQNWRWWAGRFLQCPFKVPILITETGIDTGVTGQWYGGWRDLYADTEDQKARAYVDELIWYAQQCATDGRVKAVFPFTYDIGSSHWEKFDIRSEAFMRAFLGRQKEWPQPSNVIAPPVTPPVVTPPAYRIDGRIVSRQPNMGLSYVYGAARQPNGTGWSNKPVIFYWRGNASEAGRVITKPDGRFSVEFPQRPIGQYDFALEDPVRGIKSGRLAVDVNSEQVEIEFRLVETQQQPVTPEPDTEAQRIRAAVDAFLVARPVRGGDISLRFGEVYKRQRHTGLDYAVPAGTPVLAVAPGRVALVKQLRTGYGWHVTIEHAGGVLASLYAHLSRIDVTAGQTVARGDVIGLSGATGNADGAHLHFELRVRDAQNGSGGAVDPWSLRLISDALLRAM